MYIDTPGTNPNTSEEDRSRYCAYLLVALLATIVLFPMFESQADRVGWALPISQTLILVAGSFSVTRHRVVAFTMIFGLGLMYLLIGLALSIIGNFEADAGSQKALLLLSIILLVPFYLWLIYALFRYVMDGTRLTRDRYYAVVCLYVLIGITFAHLQTAIWHGNPDSSFAFAESTGKTSFDRTSDFLYYSFSVLTTFGESGIRAMSPIAKSLSVLEALTNVILLVTVVPHFITLGRSKKR